MPLFFLLMSIGLVFLSALCLMKGITDAVIGISFIASMLFYAMFVAMNRM